ncbi:hypothetical protein [Thermosediminibacter oceani]|uniref:Uncharacterized protein n=1 Tax=Thermosediminibacter oceani (strain ATCC BAA-1034 / DSM 16646 / JW/IW-1228P) TaxID=555079 RepID=D9S293_THEOJ|nr:hypothetical protein [Thermosediminibacter oceani]ADL07520.1 hypothetical protein Toce_0754 [Thermosediminibacter oceani DSM 16646]
MSDGNNGRPDFGLMEMVVDVIQGRRGNNFNELISLLALSNILGIITYLNSQELKNDIKVSSPSKLGSSDIKELAASLLGALGGSSDKKINPATLLNLVKTFSSGEGSPSEAKGGKSGDEKAKHT